MENSLGEYQTILVLGGRSDIGRAIAREVATPFTQKIVLAGRDVSSSDVSEFEQMLAAKSLGSIEVVSMQFDASATAEHMSFARSLPLNRIDLVVVAFGQLGSTEAMVGDPAAAAQLVTVNMSGVVSSTLACAARLVEQGSGHIVFVSSVAGVRTRRSNFIYGATKAGMDAFAQGLGDYLCDKGVRVTIVRPGFVKSSMTRGLPPAPFAVEIDEVARSVVQGLRRRSRIIWVPGILRYVFAVLRILPIPIWRRLPIN